MARIRTVKPEFWESETIGCLSFGARLLFLACLNLADDEGLLRWNANYLSAHAFMYDELDPKNLSKWMSELEQNELVFAYEGGKVSYKLAWIINFKKHQVINKPQPSKLPKPTDYVKNTNYGSNSRNDSGSNSRTITGLEKEREKELEGDIEDRRKEAENPPVPPPEIPKVVKPKKVIPVFIPPTIEESENFFVEKMQTKWNVEFAAHQGRSFYNHFTSNGWLVSGKSPMKDWKAAASNWMGRTTKSEEIKFLNGGNNGKINSGNRSAASGRGGSPSELADNARKWADIAAGKQSTASPILSLGGRADT